MGNANKWVIRLLWGGFAIVNAAILAAFWMEGRGGGGEWLKAIDRVFLFLVLALLSPLVLGLMLHFLGSLRRPVVPPDSGEVVLALPGSRAGSVAMFMALCLLGAGVAYALGLWGQGIGVFDDPASPLTFEWKAVIGFFPVVWAFLLLVSVVRAVRNPPWFVLTRKGFVY